MSPLVVELISNVGRNDEWNVFCGLQVEQIASAIRRGASVIVTAVLTEDGFEVLDELVEAATVTIDRRVGAAPRMKSIIVAGWLSAHAGFLERPGDGLR